jgi:hypothetical protein
MAKDRICNVDFMEEIQKYGCLHSKFFSKDYKNKEFKKCLAKVAEKFNITKDEDSKYPQAFGDF